ncbi:MAG: RNA polymerase sigma factor [Candidatus Aminicenantes bacterium]|nr:RNA polymerase sigma factor [Candidatus Aminicenantes bacterium]
MNETDKELVAMVLAGRTEAFEPLVTPYRGPVLALAYRLTRDREVAREVAQEAFLKAFRSLGRFDVSRPFRNWLFQIAANEARDRLRGRAREQAAVRDGGAGGTVAAADPEAGHDRRELRAGLMRLLEALSPREREVVVLRDLEELDIRETSRVLGCSAVAVRVHLSKARRKLADLVRRDFPHLEEGR